MNLCNFIFLLTIFTSLEINCAEDRIPAQGITNENSILEPLKSSEINPQLFGLTQPGEQYVAALRALAQAIFYHHQFLEETKAFDELLQRQSAINTRHQMATFNRIALLDQTPNATFMLGEDKGYYEKLKEIKEALISGRQHDNIFTTSDGIRLFAASAEGITFLLMHKSLFTEPLNKSHENLIDQLCKSSLNMEVMTLALHLKTKLQESLFKNEFDVQNQKWLNTLQKLHQSFQIIITNYQNPSKKLIIILNALTKLTSCHVEKIQQRMKLGFIVEFYDQRLAMIQAEDAYNRLQITNTYELLVRPLKQLILKFGNKNPFWKQFSKTVFDELLPLTLPVEKAKELRAEEPSQKQAVTDATDTQKPTNKNKKNLQDETKPDVAPVSTLPPKIVDEKLPEKEPIEKPIDQTTPVEQYTPSEKLSEPMPVAAKTPEISIPSKKKELVVIENYEDGIIEVEVKNQIVKIHDVCNNMRLYLYPTENGCKRLQIKKITYKHNVSVWFENVNKALGEQGYLDRNNKKFCADSKRKTEIIRMHRFSKHVDKFLSTMGVQNKALSRISPNDKVTCIVIPGHIELLESGENKTCYFVYFIDGQNKCFHRNIQFKKPSEIPSDFLSKGFFEAEFPPLGWTDK